MFSEIMCVWNAVEEPNSFPLANDPRPSAQSNCQFPQCILNVVEMCVSVREVSWWSSHFQMQWKVFALEIFFMINAQWWPNKGRMQVLLYFVVFLQEAVLFLSRAHLHFYFFFKLRTCRSLRESVRAWLIFMWIPTKPPLFTQHRACGVCSLETHFCQSLFVPDKEVVFE